MVSVLILLVSAVFLYYTIMMRMVLPLGRKMVAVPYPGKKTASFLYAMAGMSAICVLLEFKNLNGSAYEKMLAMETIMVYLRVLLSFLFWGVYAYRRFKIVNAKPSYKVCRIIVNVIAQCVFFFYPLGSDDIVKYHTDVIAGVLIIQAILLLISYYLNKGIVANDNSDNRGTTIEESNEATIKESTKSITQECNTSDNEAIGDSGRAVVSKEQSRLIMERLTTSKPVANNNPIKSSSNVRHLILNAQRLVWVLVAPVLLIGLFLIVNAVLHSALWGWMILYIPMSVLIVFSFAQLGRDLFGDDCHNRNIFSYTRCCETFLDSFKVTVKSKKEIYLVGIILPLILSATALVYAGVTVWDYVSKSDYYTFKSWGHYKSDYLWYNLMMAFGPVLAMVVPGYVRIKSWLNSDK